MIDTNVLVYDTFEDSLYHRNAASLLDELDRWLIPMIVVYEYVWFLRGLSIDTELAREKVLEYITDEKTSIIKEEISDVKWAFSTLVEEELSLSRFNDKVILAIAARRELPLASYDTKLRAQATKLGVTVLPRLL